MVDRSGKGEECTQVVSLSGMQKGTLAPDWLNESKWRMILRPTSAEVEELTQRTIFNVKATALSGRNAIVVALVNSFARSTLILSPPGNLPVTEPRTQRKSPLLASLLCNKSAGLLYLPWKNKT